MAKITDLTELTVAPDNNDLVIIEDVSATTSKKIQIVNLFAALLSPGGLIAYAGSGAPAGWLLCDGSAVSRTTYAALFAVISTTYGAGNGSTTFNVPDLRGRVPAGVNGATFAALNTKGGEESHTLSTAELPAHSHVLPVFANHNYTGGGFNPVDPDAGFGTGDRTANEGGGGAHNNLQPFIALNFIIKT